MNTMKGVSSAAASSSALAPGAAGLALPGNELTAPPELEPAAGVSGDVSVTSLPEPARSSAAEPADPDELEPASEQANEPAPRKADIIQLARIAIP
jgi:hypothetical protein